MGFSTVPKPSSVATSPPPRSKPAYARAHGLSFDDDGAAAALPEAAAELRSALVEIVAQDIQERLVGSTSNVCERPFTLNVIMLMVELRYFAVDQGER